MMTSDERLQVQAQLVADAFARAYNKKHGTNIPVPVTIEYNLEDEAPKSAGMACMAGRVLQLNMIMFREPKNHKEFFNQVIPHEVAHLGQFDIEAKQGLNRKINKGSADHGVLWCSLMRSMAKEPLQFHKMDTSAAIAHYKARQAKLKERKNAQQKD